MSGLASYTTLSRFLRSHTFKLTHAVLKLAFLLCKPITTGILFIAVFDIF